jgi:ABC-2 type transport system ATP-binding protein
MSAEFRAAEPWDALRLRGLCKSFGKIAVDNLDLTVNAGELYALLGPNGAGKTTTLRIVAGLLPADAGEIQIFGINARNHPLAAKRITAWLPDEPMLYDQLTPIEHLEFIAGLWQVEPRQARAKAMELFNVLQLAEHQHERCGGLSRGTKQKVALAGALLDAPKLLLLDEPFTGLDTAMARQVKDLLTECVRNGAAIILTTHILEVAERLADRIGIIQHGRLLAQGTLADLRSRAGGRDATLEDVFLRLTADRNA